MAMISISILSVFPFYQCMKRMGQFLTCLLFILDVNDTRHSAYYIGDFGSSVTSERRKQEQVSIFEGSLVVNTKSSI